jgi:hypothetical protein
MRTVSLISAILLLLTAPYWFGLLSGLWHQRVYAGFVRRRGVWMLLQWPWRQIWRGQRWLFDWCPPIYGVLLAVVFISAVVLTGDGVLWLLSTIEQSRIVGDARLVTGVTEISGAGRIWWRLGDTEAMIRNNTQDALKCSMDQQSLYGSQAMFLSRGALLRLPADTFQAGVYCGALSRTDHRSAGIRVGPAP